MTEELFALDLSDIDPPEETFALDLSDVVEDDGAFAFSADNAQKMTASGLASLSRLTGSPHGEAMGASLKQRQEMDLLVGAYRPDYDQSFRTTLADDGLGAATGWVGEKLAENSVSGGTALVGGLAAAATAPFSVPAASLITAVTVGGSYVMGVGEAAEEIEEMTGAQHDGVAAGIGVLVAALDRFGAGKVVPKSTLMNMTSGQLYRVLKDNGKTQAADYVKGLSAKAAAQIAKSRTAAGVKGFVGEAATEAVQEGLIMTGAASVGGEYNDAEVIDRLIDSGVVGGTLGGGVATVAHSPRRTIEGPPDRVEQHNVEPAAGGPVAGAPAAAVAAELDVLAMDVPLSAEAELDSIGAAIDQMDADINAELAAQAHAQAQLTAENEYVAQMNAGDVALDAVDGPALLDPELEMRQSAEALAPIAPKPAPMPKAKPWPQVDPERDDLLTAMAKLGGIRPEVAAAEGIDLKDNQRRGMHTPFKKNGVEFDAMAEALQQHGYATPDANSLLNLVLRATQGQERIFTPEGQYRHAEQVAASQQALNALNPDDASPIAGGYDAEVAAVEGVSEEERVLAHFVDMAIDGGVAPAVIDQVLDSQYETPYQYAGALLAKIQEADHGQTDQPGSGEGAGTENSTAPGSEIPGFEPETRQTEAELERSQKELDAFFGIEANPEFDLEAQTAPTLAAREQAIAEANATQAAAATVAQDKAQADAEVGDFLLTGADTVADRAAARGQNDLFAAGGDKSRPAAPRSLDAARGLTPDTTEGKPLAEDDTRLASKGKLSAMDALAHEAATSPLNDLPEPSAPQKEAGNYQKGHITFQGLDIAIENPAGSTRTGTATDGRAWESKMYHHYGDVKGSQGADGDAVDVFIGPNDAAPKVFVIDQVNPDGSFDEHKVMLGFDHKIKAVAGYKKNYEKGWKVGPMTTLTVDEFKHWLAGDTTKPLSGAWQAKGDKTEVVKTVKGSRLTEKAEANIDDFGEVLTGAKKHTYTFTTALDFELDVGAVPLSKSFPQPDYEKLAADGVAHPTLALIALLRAGLGTKPRRAGQIKRWVEKVELARAAATKLLGGELAAENIAETMRPGSETQYIVDVINIAKELPAAEIKVLGDFRLDLKEFIVFDKKKDVSKWVVSTVSKKGLVSRQHKQEYFDDKAAALKFIKARVTELASGDNKRLTKFDVWYERGVDGYFVGKKVGARKYISLADGFKTGAEARTYIDENTDKLIMLLKQKKAVKDIRREENNPRVGEDYRKGKNATQALFAETFGFRGVQFGNWVENDRRQQDLNNAYDGLLDLAKLLAVPPKALALNGELGLAFGARGGGRGGNIQAAAHYEPSNVVINLTKKHGSGSLAHEWWHALDNYFSRQENEAEQENMLGRDESVYLTETRRSKMLPKEGGWGKAKDADFGVRREVYDAFQGIRKTIETETGLVERSAALDNTRAKDYWSTVRELTARSFEIYVIDRLAKNGNESDYLANVVSEDAHNARDQLYQTTDPYPYPLKSEMKVLAPAYDGLFKNLKTKPTEHGVMLFSKAAMLGPNDKPKGMAVARVEALVQQFLHNFKGTDDGLEIKVFRDESEWPAVDAEQGARHKAAFEHKTNTLYVVAANLNNSLDLKKTLQHELLVHKGLGLFDQATETQIIQSILVNAPKSKLLREAWKKIQQDYQHYPRLVQAEELLAHLAESHLVQPLIDGLDGDKQALGVKANVDLFVRKIFQTIIKALRALMRMPKPTQSFEEGLLQTIYDVAVAFKEGRYARRRTYPEQDEKAAPYYGVDLDAGVGDLATDYAARMARAVEQGYITDLNDVIRGGDEDGGFNDSENEPDRAAAAVDGPGAEGRDGPGAVYSADRSRAPGGNAGGVGRGAGDDHQRSPQTFYHGSQDDISGFELGHGNRKDAGWLGYGIYLATQPGLANEYTKRKVGHDSANVLPVFVRAQSIYRASPAIKAQLKNSTQGQIKTFTDRLIAQGYEGAALDYGDGNSEVVIFDPTRIRSANAQFNPALQNSNDLLFSRARGESVVDLIDQVDDAGLAQALVDGKNVKPIISKLDNFKSRHWSKLLALIPRRYLSDFAERTMTGVKHYIRLAQQMDADRNQLLSESAGIVDRWTAWMRSHKAEAEVMAELMPEATMVGYDPAKPYQALITAEEVTTQSRVLREQALGRSGEGTGKFLKKMKALRIRLAQERKRAKARPYLELFWRRLGPEGQAIYREVRDHYTLRRQQTFEALRERVERAEAGELEKGRLQDLLREEFESNTVEEPYFPLFRFGDYWAVAKTETGEVAAYTMFEDLEGQREWLRETEAKGMTTDYGRTSKEDSLDARVDPAFAAKVTTLVSGLGGPTANNLANDIWQLYLQSLPAMSSRKHYISRKKRRGFSKNAVRGFAHMNFHAGHQLAKLRHADGMEAELAQVQQQAKRAERRDLAMPLYDELKAGHEWAMNPKGSAWANKATSFGFSWYLGATPAAAMVNMTQTPMVALPVLGAKHGFMKAAKALAKASALITKPGDIEAKLTGDELAAIQEMVRSGLIDKTQAHDLAGIGESETEYSPRMHWVMEKVAWMFHKAEHWNREVTALAGYRLARAEGVEHAEAVLRAEDMVWDSHFDYSNANRPRVIRNDAAKVFLLFKQHSLNMTYRMIRDFSDMLKHESPVMRREAKRRFFGIMGTAMVFGGARSLPLASVLILMANALGEVLDEDEPINVETEIRIHLAEAFGTTTADILWRGLADETGASISTRVSLSNLWFRDADERLEGADKFWHYAKEGAGPLFSAGANLMEGFSMLGGDNRWRGLEKMVPKALRDVSRAVRYTSEGVLNYRHDPIMEKGELLPTEIFAQLVGFSPTALGKQYEVRGAKYDAVNRLKERRYRLLNAYYLAARYGDDDELVGVFAKIQTFNGNNPEYPINGRSLRQSIRMKNKRSNQSNKGLYLNPRMRFLDQEINF